MKVLVYGKNKDEITSVIEETGFVIVESKPDFVICYGGDGTLMAAESAYPGVKKILLRDSQICKKCSNLPNHEVLRRVAAGEFVVEELPKIRVTTNGRSLYALNDITVHNGNPRHAIRYDLHINDRFHGNGIIGDGIVVATPFGSTGYYRSITDSYFEVGIGLAFNNSTEQSDHIVLKESSEIKLRLLRGPASIFADNQREEIEIKEGDEVLVRKSEEKALILML